jgi:hypothetical protein
MPQPPCATVYFEDERRADSAHDIIFAPAILHADDDDRRDGLSCGRSNYCLRIFVLGTAMRASSASIVTAAERVLCLRPTMYDVMTILPGCNRPGIGGAIISHLAPAYCRRHEPRRIAANIGKLPDLVQRWSSGEPA